MAMTISLTSRQQALIVRLISSCRCRSEADAVSLAFELLEKSEAALAELRQPVQDGIAAADRGELVDAEEVYANLKADHEAAFGKQAWGG